MSWHVIIKPKEKTMSDVIFIDESGKKYYLVNQEQYKDIDLEVHVRATYFSEYQKAHGSTQSIS